MLHGREAEQSEIDRLLAAAREGRSGALVLRGEPGIGKSALLDYAAAQGIPTVRSSGIESEAELSFAALHLLLRPGMALTETLPARQRDALHAAFGLGDGTPPDRMLVGLAVLTLLAEESADTPLLCLIDDAHWLDRASAETLLFVARRLDAEGVALIFAARPGELDFPAPGLPELTLTGLRPEAAAALVDSRSPDLAPAVRYRLLTEAHGNPLALRELPAVLAAELPGSGPNPLPLTQRLQVAFHGQVSRMPAGTRTLLLVAAAAGSDEIATVLRASRSLGADLDDLQPAVDAGMVRSDGRTLGFRHPLLRSAVYQGAPLAQRLAAHAALAAALAAPEDADLRAWQLAAAATGPDENTAAALEDSADRARRRSGFSGAASAYERAAGLSTDPEARVRRLVAAAETAGEAGQLERSQRLAERAAAQTADVALRARLDLVSATAEFGDGRMRAAHHRLLTGAATIRDLDPACALRMLAQAVHTAWYLSAAEIAEVAQRLDAVRGAPGPAAAATAPATADIRQDEVPGHQRDSAAATPGVVTSGEERPAPTSICSNLSDAGSIFGSADAQVPGAAIDQGAPVGPGKAAATFDESVATRAPSGDSLTALIVISRYTAAAVSGRYTVDLRDAARAARAGGADSPRDLVQMCGAGLVVGQDEQVGELARELIGECREQGRLALLPTLLFFRAEAEVYSGRPAEARIAATEGLRIAQDIGQVHWVSQQSACLAYLAALGGRDPECREWADRALAPELGGADAAGATWIQAALGLLELGLGKVDSALTRFETLTVEPAAHHVIGLRTLPDLIEAAVRLGNSHHAEDALGRLGAWAERSGQAWVTALAERGRALTVSDAKAEQHFHASLELGVRPFEQARTQLLYGEWLRRARRKTDARNQLQPAVETFDRLEATPWGDRARTELAALGVGAAARPAAGVLAALTPQELQIARLAAQGMSNRDIAAQLFLSPRTVGHHLYKAYPKLGVLSRGELAALPFD
ncbi:AAA family ATPase [Nocardia sp. NPDC127579]|uniref:helix-turn-helix transcriptional regulator n=1 Tax=Nocardia sp. NPDC127579 TaxID=3345402 RepID=UPI00362F5337